MKILIVVLFVAVLAGCTSYEGTSVKDYIKNPQYLVEDKHFESYEKELDAAEREYLNKDISYAEYQEKKSKLENKYSKEVKDREQIFSQDY